MKFLVFSLSMASPPRSSSSLNILTTLRYSSNYSYPLTESEIYFWQLSSPPLSPNQIHTYLHVLMAANSLHKSHNLYYLPGHATDVSRRLLCQKSSRAKWLLAQKIATRLRLFPGLWAIFVTGSLAMNNSPGDDDIDLMLVTAPHALWIIRPLVVIYLYLFHLRRHPGYTEHSSYRVSDKICDNLWLDAHHLAISPHTSFLAHEILQAVCVWDKHQIYSRFLYHNSWVKTFLPIAYSHYLKKVPPPATPPTFNFAWYAPLNRLLYRLQLIYMQPRRSSETLSEGFAFFHPRFPSDHSVL